MDSSNKIKELRSSETEKRRTSFYLFGASFFFFCFLIVGIILDLFPNYVMIILLVGMVAFIGGGVEFSLRSRIDGIYSDLLERLDTEDRLQKLISLEDIPDL
jgi:hypothetical protein